MVFVGELEGRPEARKLKSVFPLHHSLTLTSSILKKKVSSIKLFKVDCDVAPIHKSKGSIVTVHKSHGRAKPDSVAALAFPFQMRYYCFRPMPKHVMFSSASALLSKASVMEEIRMFRGVPEGQNFF